MISVVFVEVVIAIWLFLGVCAAIVASDSSLPAGSCSAPLGTGAKCLKCASRISSEAKICPDCGYAVRETKTSQRGIIFTGPELEAMRTGESENQLPSPRSAVTEATKRSPFCAERDSGGGQEVPVLRRIS